ncbi:MAG TPA: type II secretion system F family protein [Dietzia timorensis]|uniref:Type II secretion system F family protein n=1 Tax=Dietzia timorensis TaxID=499555 RepID=A0A921F6D8_9ACTN|nr:type II secretion system F family protein [Dietzia timorensis]HJE92115.1 type II secretion system F family protein [Dietzia timorensis]
MTTNACALLAAAVLAWPGPASASRLRTLGSGPRAAVPFAAVRGVDSSSLALVLGAVASVLALVAGVGVGLVAGAAIVGVALRHVLHGERSHARKLREDEAWVGALDSIVSALASGASMGAALRAARHGSSGAVTTELERAVALDGLGGDVAGLLAASSALPARRLGQAVALSTGHGLPLADVVRRAGEEVSETNRHAGEIEAALAGPRATALILTALPLLGLGLGHLMGADPVGTLGSGIIGAALAIVGSALIAAGLLWTSRIIAGVRA